MKVDVPLRCQPAKEDGGKKNTTTSTKMREEEVRAVDQVKLGDLVDVEVCHEDQERMVLKLKGFSLGRVEVAMLRTVMDEEIWNKMKDDDVARRQQHAGNDGGNETTMTMTMTATQRRNTGREASTRCVHAVVQSIRRRRDDGAVDVVVRFTPTTTKRARSAVSMKTPIATTNTTNSKNTKKKRQRRQGGGGDEEKNSDEETIDGDGHGDAMPAAQGRTRIENDDIDEDDFVLSKEQLMRIGTMTSHLRHFRKTICMYHWSQCHVLTSNSLSLSLSLCVCVCVCV